MRKLMRLVVYAVLIPCLIDADCGCETREERRDRQLEERIHACRSCKGITPSIEDCPPLGYECDEEWPMVTNVLAVGDCSCSELRCVGRLVKIAVNGSIADRVRCAGGKWTVGREETTSAVCAQFCGLGVCSITPSTNPLNVPLTVAAPTEEEKCATGSCANGAVALNADGTLNKELVGVNTVSYTGTGLWRNGDEEHQFVVCKEGPPACETACNPTPMTVPALNPSQPTAAIRTGCSFSCGPNEALLRLDAIVGAVSISSATCEDTGEYRLNSTLSVAQIGCRTCDEPDGEWTATVTAVKAVAKGCVWTCPDGYTLQYYPRGSSDDKKSVDALYRQLQGPTPVGTWYDSERSAWLNRGYELECNPNE